MPANLVVKKSRPVQSINDPSDATAAVAIAPSTEPALTPVAAMKKKTPEKKLTQRRFTSQHEEKLIAAWGECVHQYYGGVPKKAIIRIQKEVNSLVLKPPFFSEKQITNKLRYMEKRYKDIRDEFTASGYGVMKMGEGSLNMTVERKFPFFFSVNEVLGSRTYIEPEYVVDAGGLEVEGGSQMALTTSQKKGVISGAVAIGSDSDGERSDEETGKIKCTPKKGKISSKSMSESLLSSIVSQSAADERQHTPMMIVMHGEFLVSQAELEMTKHAAASDVRKGKGEGLRKLAEFHATLGNNGKAVQILRDAHDILTQIGWF